jgi:GNAT superfamily N-acetyltransferase
MPALAGPAFGAKIDPSETRLPVVRAIFVDPLFAGHGLGRIVMDRVEAEIARAGFERATLLATLSGAPFYRARGWRGDQPVLLPLPQGRLFVTLRMEKRLPRAA